MPNHKQRPTRHNGPAIRDFRVHQGIDARQFAEMIGLSKQGLLNIETGTRDTKREVLYRIARALDVSIHSILRDETYADGLAAAERSDDGRSAA